MKNLLLCLVLIQPFLGCATILHQKTQLVAFTSTPDNAVVRVDGKTICRTPCEAELSNKKDHEVVIKLTPGRVQEFTATHSVGIGWVLLDLLTPGSLGSLIVDGASGNWYYLDYDTFDANFSQK